MAGQYGGFNAAEFRDAITFAMNMGAPNDSTRRVKFRWTTRRSYSIADSGGDPFDWTATPTQTITVPEVEIPCAVQLSASPVKSAGSPIGSIDPQEAKVYVLDRDYELLFDDEGVRADLCIIDTNTYTIEYEEMAMGLFEVTVHTFAVQARDES